MQKALSAFLLSTITLSLLLVLSASSGSAQVPTQVSGIITEDTTWTAAASPYVFTGTVGVAEGVTLTVEAGVTVDFGSYTLQINGTLIAEGTQSDKVVFTSDQNSVNRGKNILLTYSNPTCKLQNVLLKYTSILGEGSASSATLVIENCNLLNSSVNSWGSTSIMDSYLTGAVKLKGASTITGNNFYGGVEVSGGWADTIWAGDFLVSGNNITNNGGVAIMATGSGSLKSNFVWGANKGITQNDNTVLSATIEGNLIKENNYGIYLSNKQDNAKIKDNTITANTVGIYNPSYQLTITGNSFIDNQQYDIQAGSDAVSAKDNWWGTTDRTAIAAKIYDSNDDFSLGTVVYLPVLTSANSNTPDPNMCSVTQLQSTPTPTQVNSVNYQTGGQTNLTTFNGIEIGVITTVSIIGVLVAVIALKRRNRLVDLTQ